MDKLFQEKGKPFNAHGNVQIPMDEKETLFFLSKGSVNLFAIFKNGDGARTLLAQFSAPSLLFSLESFVSGTEYKVVAISEGEIDIWKMTTDQVGEEVLKNNDFIAPFAFYLSKWIDSLYSSSQTMSDEIWVKGDGSKEILLTGAPEEEISLSSEEIISTSKDIGGSNWIFLREGSLLFLEESSLEVGSTETPYPIAHGSWFTCLNQAKIQSAKSHELIEKGIWPAAIQAFHALFSRYFLINEEKKHQLQLNRWQDKKGEESALLSKTLSEMGGVLEAEESIPVIVTENPLLQTCMQIGQFMKVQFKAPLEFSPRADPSVHIEEICRASGLHTRQVSLTKDWWNSDAGPLLGFYGEDHLPVALLNHSPLKYEMINPLTLKKEEVGKELGEKLHSIAFSFYIPFPDDCRSIKGIGKDFYKHHRKEIPPLIIYGVIGSLIALFPPIAIGILFNQVIPDMNHSLLVQITCGLVLAAIGSSLFSYFRSLVLLRIEGLLNHQVQSALWDRLLKLPVNFFRKFSTGDLIYRVMSIDQIRSILTDVISRSILTGIFSFFYLIVMSFFSIKLTFLSLFVIFIGLMITLYCAVSNIRIGKEVAEVKANLNSAVIQIVSGVGKLRVSGAENSAFSYWANLFTKFKKLDLRSKNIQSAVSIMNSIFPILTLLLIFFVIVTSKTPIPVSVFLAFYAAYIPFSTAFFELGGAIMQMVPVFPLWARSKVILEENQEISVHKNKVTKLRGEIHLDELFFRYEEDGPLILDNVSIVVNPKEFIGIVGPSGCGKSTLLRLLLGFEKPHSGAIYFDEKDFSSLDAQGVRKQMGVVLQEGGIVGGSVYNNIVCSGIYTKEQIGKALELSGFADDVASFPMGLHTVLSMGGETLSGGQKQRLLITRALLSNPKILLFDEATSALDNRSQAKITENINKLNISRIVIAHRLSTIREADRIYVMEKGKVVQKGTFDELSRAPSLFADMLARQQL